MSIDRITVHIKMKPYLKAYIISIFGEEPIFFPKTKDSLFIKIEKYLARPPKHYKQKQIEFNNHLEVTLPYYKNTNINTKNYLSRNSQKIIEQQIDKLFWEAFQDYVIASSKDQTSRNLLITAFIEKYNLPLDYKIEDMLMKSIYRRKKLFSKLPKRQYIKKI